MAVVWKNKDAALRKVIKSLATIDKREVRVGFFNKQYSDENNNLQVAQVAQWMEEGVPSNNVPSRPMFRVDFADKISEPASVAYVGNQLKSVLDRVSTPTNVLGNIGESLTLKLKGIIAQGVPPPNKEWAVIKNGLPPLVFTGFMRDSVEYRIRYKTARQ